MKNSEVRKKTQYGSYNNKEDLILSCYSKYSLLHSASGYHASLPIRWPYVYSAAWRNGKKIDIPRLLKTTNPEMGTRIIIGK